MTDRKILKVRVNQTIHLNSLTTPVMKGRVITLKKNEAILKAILDVVSDKDISREEGTLVTILEVEDTSKAVKDKPVKKPKKGKKKGDK